MQPSIELKNVSLEYGTGMMAFLPSWSRGRRGKKQDPSERLVAVDRVSLSMNSGEHIGIIGPNGAGKSTLLRMIAGISTPTSGQVQIHGCVTAIFTLG